MITLFESKLVILKNGPSSASFIVYFWSFQTNITIFYNNIMWKDVHPVSGAEIRTHDFLDMSLLP